MFRLRALSTRTARLSSDVFFVFLAASPHCVLNRHGLVYGCGLYSYGLYSYGVYSCSLYGYGLYSYGLALRIETLRDWLWPGARCPDYRYRYH